MILSYVSSGQEWCPSISISVYYQYDLLRFRWKVIICCAVCSDADAWDDDEDSATDLRKEV